MLTVTLSEFEHQTVADLINLQIGLLESRLSTGILQDDSHEIADAIANIRILESLKMSLIKVEHS
jgi:hypothetical protein